MSENGPSPIPPDFHVARKQLLLYAKSYLDQIQVGGDLSYGLGVRVNEAAERIGLPTPFPVPTQGAGPNAQSIYFHWHDSVDESAGVFRVVDPTGTPVPVSAKDLANIEQLLRNLMVEAEALASGPATNTRRRFAIALSFPGEYRNYVKQVDGALLTKIDAERVFYDDRFKAHLARPNLDAFLQQIYHDHSELVVVFLCAEYERKEWCGLEWRAVRDLIKKRQEKEIMFFRFDDTIITGVFSIDGYIDARMHTPADAAALILQRRAANHAQV